MDGMGVGVLFHLGGDSASFGFSPEIQASLWQEVILRHDATQALGYLAFVISDGYD